MTDAPYPVDLAVAVLRQNIGKPGPWSFDEQGAAVVRQALDVVLADATRAESRSTPDREGVARIIANLRARANAAHGKAPPSSTALVCGEAADLIERLARPASSAGGVEEALERALKEAEERTANYAENIARLYKALHNASTWIGEIISNAKAEAATIGVIPTDERLGWERTEALRRSIRYALRRAALTSKGADRG